METRFCVCGCQTEIPAFSAKGTARVFVHGHQNRRPKVRELIPCACGCDVLIRAIDSKNRPRRFVIGHQARLRTEAKRIASSSTINRVRPAEPWNKGISYVITKRTTYATRGAWHKAVMRWHGDRCMRCGWAGAPCDVHHITAKRDGGPLTLENGIVLCPNCHRLAHTFSAVQAGLADIKQAAIPQVRGV